MNGEEIVSSDNTLATISLIVSIVGTIIIPLIYSLIKLYLLKRELKSFERLVQEDYIKEVDDLIEKYGYDSDPILNDEINSKLLRISFLKNEELIYLNTTNQFKMIRLIELVRSYLKNIKDITEIYFFRQPFPSLDEQEQEAIKYEKSINIKKNALLTLKTAFHDNKRDYVLLKKDHLITDTNQFLDEIRNKITNITAD